MIHYPKIEYDGWQKDFSVYIWEEGEYRAWDHYKTEHGAKIGAAAAYKKVGRRRDEKD